MTVKIEKYLVNDFDTKANGNKAVGVPITIFLTGTKQKADLFKDEGKTQIASNPVVTDESGKYEFWIDDAVCDFVTNADKSNEAYLFTQKVLASSESGNRSTPYNVPPFDGNQFTLPIEAQAVDVVVDGRILPPDQVSFVTGTNLVEIENAVNKTQRVIAYIDGIFSGFVLDDSAVYVDEYIAKASTVSEGLNDAAAVARATKKSLLAPDAGKVYVLNAPVDFTGVRSINFLSKIDTTALDETQGSVTIGGLAETNNGGYITFGEFISSNPKLANDGTNFPQLIISGLKGFILNLDNIRYLQWYPKAGVEFDSNGYNTINFAGRVCIEELTGQDTEGAPSVYWNNENNHYGSRLYKILVRDNGYPHNHNKWHDPLFEDAQAEIRFENGVNNFFYGCRWENVSGGNGVYFGEKAKMNRIYRTWISSIKPREMVQTPFGNAPFTDLNGTNWFVRTSVTDLSQQVVFSFTGSLDMVSNGDEQTKPSACSTKGTLNNPVYQIGTPSIQRASITPAINGGNYIGVSEPFKLLAQTDIIPVYNGAVFALTAKILTGSWRYSVQCFDADGAPLDDAEALDIPSATYQGGGIFSSGNRASTDKLNVGAQWPLSFNVDSPDVKYIWIGAYTGDTVDNYIEIIECRYFDPPTQHPETVIGAEEQPSELWLTSKPTMGHLPLGATVKTPGNTYQNNFELSAVTTQAESSGSSTIIISQGTNVNPSGFVSVGDVVGVTLASRKVHWSSVVSYNNGTKTVVLANPIPIGESVLNNAIVAFNRWQVQAPTSYEYLTSNTNLNSGESYLFGERRTYNLPLSPSVGDFVKFTVRENVALGSGILLIGNSAGTQYFDDAGNSIVSTANIEIYGPNPISVTKPEQYEFTMIYVSNRWELKR